LKIEAIQTLTQESLAALNFEAI